MTVMLVSSAIFIIALILIFTEKMNRSITGIAGAVLMVGAGTALEFYSQDEAITAIDFNTLGLLFGMMVLVALLEPTGFFQYLAVWAARLSKGQPVRLMILLGTVTTILSMFLDNVTTVVLIAPVTVLISEILGLNPVPYLMAEALLSDTGGVATLVGDPPNVLIASAANFSFNDFLTHSLPVVLFAWLAALFLLLYLFRKDLRLQPSNTEAVLKLDPSEALNDRKTTTRVLIVLGIALVFFFIHHTLHVQPAFIALAAAATALVWTQPDLHAMLQRIEWNVLIFFGALFVMVGGLEAAGVLHQAAGLIGEARNLSPVLFGVVTIWVVAGLSAVVDNIPITIALIPVFAELELAGINVQPLWWALAFGAGFGGNGTIIGSTANVFVATLSERTKYPITSQLWNKRGLPVMIVTCFVGSILFVLLYPYLSS
ncbi:MAG: ArsB/NhaD family transporter [Anaerolineales bacterium]|nr:ArsB/NhaD family transporter [Anaerolineales bacterium]